MESKKRLFIHIGTNKTGTSAIQCFLNARQKELAENGLLYPRAGCAGGAHYEISRVLGFDHGKQPAPDAEKGAFLEQFKSEVKLSRCNTCVISSENFVLPRNVALVRDFFSDFDCKIVVYFRRHDHWWLSAYNQATKMVVNPPWAWGFQGFLNFNRKKNPQYGNYRALLDRWDKVFGEENIIVRPYERQQNKPNIIADFFAAIGVPDLYLPFSDDAVSHVNQSLDVRSVFLLETFQRMDVEDHIRRSLIEYVMKSANLGEKERFITPELCRKLVDEEMQQYKYIAKKYMHRPDGVLFQEPLPDPKANWEKPQYPTIVEVANIVAHVLSSKQ